jgi:hypothetical protein
MRPGITRIISDSSKLAFGIENAHEFARCIVSLRAECG